MKIMIIAALVAFGASSALGSGFMTHEQIVRQIQQNKVGKAPQQCMPKNGKKCKTPKPKYNKASEILPKKKHPKKHNRKKDYSKHGGGKK